MRIAVGIGLAVLFLTAATSAAEPTTALAEGVRGLVTRAKEPVAVDGSLKEWSGDFCTPVHDNHAALADRAAQFFYQWDDKALFIGLRALDRHPANPGQGEAVFDGDAVEFYLDTRTGKALGGKDWTDGAVHLFYSPFQGTDLKPRWVMRQGIATSGVVLKGVEIAATVHDWGYEIEFAIPWANFPDFAPKTDAVIALDAELCSGDGGGRTDRTFAYGSPLSVQQPASLGRVQLVESFDPSYLPAVGAAAFPMWVETPWNQPDRARCRATVAIQPSLIDEVGGVEIRLHDPEGQVVKTIPAKVESFGPEGLRFARAVADWSIDERAPGTYFATARIAAKGGKTLATVAPRMVQEANMTGR